MGPLIRPAGRLLALGALALGLSSAATAQDRPNIKPDLLFAGAVTAAAPETQRSRSD